LLAVVAHSMGGLVARGFVVSSAKQAAAVRTFVTLSSPVARPQRRRRSA
jgi:triacylglycerol esterase/lipase EstA (alpha/beta hydrolase family)